MIKLKNVVKIYNINANSRLVALESINLQFAKGELIILKGASGSGKSTILSLIAGLSKPTSGEIVVDDKRISKLTDDFASIYRRFDVGYIFQKYNLIPNLSLKDNILLPLIPSNISQKESNIRLEKVLNQFSIYDKKNIIVRNLSGGEQQRVAICRSLINNPKIIIADEPTANLDEKLSLDFCNILKQLKSNNKTIIIATHDPIFFKLDFVDRVVEIKNGQII
jgi:putative ABC transport system ATP-binding protein